MSRSPPPPTNVREEDERPVYLIAHRCNDVEDIHDALQKGANAVEVDARSKEGSFLSLFGSSSTEWFADHDAVMPWSTELPAWLDGAKQSSETFGDRFAAIHLDIKTPSSLDGLHGLVQDELGSGPQAPHVIYSTANFDNVQAIDALPAGKEGQTDGVMIDEGSDAAAVLDHFQQRKEQGDLANHWYGSGLAADWPVRKFGGRALDKVKERLRYAVQRRDEGTGAPKVVAWTAKELTEVQEYFLTYHVDGVLVEKETVSEAAKMIEASDTLRLAKRSDPAFEVFKGAK